MSMPVSDKCEPFIHLDKLIPVLSDLYTAIKSRNEKCQEMLQGLISRINRIADTHPDATIAAIHLSKQQSPLKQPIYGAILAHLFSQQHGLDDKKEQALAQAVLTCNLTFYEFQVLLNSMDGKLTDAQRTDIFAIGKTIMAPFPTTTLRMCLVSVSSDATGKDTVDWAESYNSHGNCPAKGAVLTSVPAGVLPASQSVIMAKASYAYASPIKFVMPSSINFYRTFYLRPRKSDTVTRSAT